jgi:hypothetical protein
VIAQGAVELAQQTMKDDSFAPREIRSARYLPRERKRNPKGK